MRLDDDDFEDYEGDYDDNQAANEVMALVPSASEDDAWDALEKFDFDVDAAVAHLKAKLKPKPAPKPKAKPTPKPAPVEQNSQGKSKLQQLALKKQNGAKGDALSRLRNKGDTSQPKSALARLLAKKNTSSTSSASPEPSESPKSGSSTSLATPEDHPTPDLIVEPEIIKVVRPLPSSFGSLLGFSDACLPKSSISNAVSTSSNATLNFAKPSPDDRVKNAQDRAFTKPTQSVVAPKKAAAKSKSKDMAAISQLSLKPHASFVVIGHVDAGKSTLMGRLLLDAGAISQRTIEKFKRESEKMGKSSFALAWAMDATAEERARGVTVDVGEASFETEKIRFTVVDAPGHRDYVPNMIAGVSQADIAVLVVDADANAFESGFSLDGQTKEHAVLARSLGIDSMVIAVNKLDTQGWDEERFEDIKVQLTEFLSKVVGYSPSKLQFIPTSGRDGDYVLKTSTAASWYNGPTLVEALESIEIRQRDIDAPFRMICSNVYQEDFQPHTTVVGRVVSGAIEKEDPLVNCSEQDVACSVKAVSDKEYAVAGEVADLKLDISTEQCRPGDILCAPEGLLPAITEFTAKIILFDLKRPVLVGATLSFYLGRVDQSVKISKIEASFDKKGEVLKKMPRHLTKGQAARVRLTLNRPTVLTPFSKVRDLGRFVLRLDGSTVGGGVIESIGTDDAN